MLLCSGIMVFETQNRPQTKSTQEMLSPEPPERIHVAFDDHRLVANLGDKVMTLVASALAGGGCIDDADVLRAGGTAGAIGCVVKAPSTLGTFLFRS